jgi:glutamine amidotransferase PdxT
MPPNRLLKLNILENSFGREKDAFSRIMITGKKNRCPNLIVRTPAIEGAVL